MPWCCHLDLEQAALVADRGDFLEPERTRADNARIGIDEAECRIIGDHRPHRVHISR